MFSLITTSVVVVYSQSALHAHYHCLFSCWMLLALLLLLLLLLQWSQSPQGSNEVLSCLWFLTSSHLLKQRVTCMSVSVRSASHSHTAAALIRVSKMEPGVCGMWNNVDSLICVGRPVHDLKNCFKCGFAQVAQEVWAKPRTTGNCPQISIVPDSVASFDSVRVCDLSPWQHYWWSHYCLSQLGGIIT